MLRRNTNTIVITPQKKELDEIRLQVNSEKNNIQVLSQEIIKLENKKSDLSKEVQKLLDSFLFSQSKNNFDIQAYLNECISSERKRRALMKLGAFCTISASLRLSVARQARPYSTGMSTSVQA